MIHVEVTAWWLGVGEAEMERKRGTGDPCWERIASLFSASNVLFRQRM